MAYIVLVKDRTDLDDIDVGQAWEKGFLLVFVHKMHQPN